ncbi:MAG: hypothetical protein IH840_17810 [Candidatus Heimdallarchaeota archaeon]|nr:hypothetical protein [Candidatus Heimdallarchaeota archaeon]
MEALDVILTVKGYRIDVGDPKVHYQREIGLAELKTSDNRFLRISDMYSSFKNILHGTCFYTEVDPQPFKNDLLRVGEFISLIEEMLDE